MDFGYEDFELSIFGEVVSDNSINYTFSFVDFALLTFVSNFHCDTLHFEQKSVLCF